MPIAKETANIVPVPSGNHLGVCYSCVDLGTQPDDQFGPRQKLMLTWELPGELLERDGKELPMVISREYTLSLNPKSNLRKDLESWRGRPFTPEELKGFDVATVVGKGCMLNVIHVEANGRVNARISSIASVPKGMKVPALVNMPIKFDLEHGPDSESYKALPEWIRNKIGGNPEKGLPGCIEWQPKQKPSGPAHLPPPTPPVDPVDDSDIPF